MLAKADIIIVGLQRGEGMEPDDLLCSRNARPQKDGRE